MITKDLFQFPFQGFQASAECSKRNTIPKFNQVLTVMILPWFILVSTAEKPCQPSPKCQKLDLRRRTYFCSTGILTCFPFPSLQLGDWLGSTNPWLNCIVKEPLPFQRRRFSLRSDPTTTRILNPIRSTPSHEEASALTGHLPTNVFWTLHSIGNRFSPVHFQGSQSWQVSCYALFKG